MEHLLIVPLESLACIGGKSLYITFAFYERTLAKG